MIRLLDVLYLFVMPNFLLKILEFPKVSLLVFKIVSVCVCLILSMTVFKPTNYIINDIKNYRCPLSETQI